MDIAKIRKKLQKSEPVDHPRSKDEEKTKGDNFQYGEQNYQEEPVSEKEKQAVHEEEKPDSSDKGTDLKPQMPESRIESEAEEELIEILTFSLLKEDYAFKVSQLHEILRYQRITNVPRTPDYVLGITSLRGKVIPVLDLKRKLSLTTSPSLPDNKGKILIIKGPNGPIGILVDKVISVMRVAKSDILPPPPHLTDSEVKFIEGVTVREKRFISIINMDEAICINL